MSQLINNIYYVDNEILKIIEATFELIDRKGWYRLYRHKIDRSYWRLDEQDKYQEQFFVRLESSDHWAEFNDQQMRMELLKTTRGTTNDKCTWNNCERNALTEIVLCEYHAYKEMGMRK